ncbi:DUF3823 domain-containing protein [Pseudoflavitalea sp. X16]|nr:DUF3823 domain-containing protein [Paraflavitalea devenefica]
MVMKIKAFFYITSAAIIMLTACKKDNYAPPSSLLTGKVVYQGQPVGVRSNGVQLELWQRGYQLFTKIPVYIDQDGSFSASLFDGKYKLVRLKGNGPWADNTDSIDVTVSGNTVIDVPVDPYFIIKNEAFQKNGSNIDATFTVQAVNTSKSLEAVRLYLGLTTITDQSNNAANASKAAAAIDITQPVTLSAAIPAAATTKGYVFVRLGVKTAGVQELYYTAPQKVSLK